MSKIRAIIKRPDEQYGHVTNISNTLENLQRTVGGYIETVTIFGPRDGESFVIICDEEGRLKGKNPNCQVPSSFPRKPHGFAETLIDFYGDIVIVGVDGDEFTDCPLDFKDWKSMVLLPEGT